MVHARALQAIPEFPLLATPIMLGSVRVSNRIMMTAHTTRLAENHLPGAILREYHAERAKGGVGIIVLEATSVHPSSEPRQKMLLSHDDTVIPAYRELAQAVQRHGTRLVAQLYHAGMHSDGSNNRSAVWAPSPVRSPAYNETPHEMTVEDIREVVDGFAAASARAQAGGLDGVEIHAANSYLLQQFLSPATNHRTDHYGGSFENRTRLLFEVIRAVGAATSGAKSFIVGIRLGTEEGIPGGLDIDETCRIAASISATVPIGYLSVAAGSYHDQAAMVPPMEAKHAVGAWMAARIKAVANDVPVVTVGRITHPQEAETILRNGSADLIGLARAFIADPEWARKSLGGRSAEIRPCIGCNQLCVGRMPRDQSISCIHNPAVGKEAVWGVDTFRSTMRPKRVLVAGGGPAGMETARVAALRGHTVTLYESSDALGGQANLAARVPFRSDFVGLVDFLEQQVHRLDVDIHLGEKVTPDLVQTHKPDVLVVATGSLPVKSGYSVLRPSDAQIPGTELPHVFTVSDAFTNRDRIGRRVLLIDEDGHWPGVGTALHLATEGHEVQIVTRFLSLAPELLPTLSLPLVYRELQRLQVHWRLHTAVRQLGKRTARVQEIYSGAKYELSDFDSVVVAMGNRAQDELYRELKGRVHELYLVGDAAAPRRADMAIFDGHRVGRSIE